MATENLFNIIYSGYTTPLEAEQLKAQVQIKQNEAQAGMIELAQQKATMGVMQKIWGSPLGINGATGTDDDKAKLNMTAAYLMQKGNVAGATQVLSRVSSIEERQAQTAKDRLEAEGKRQQQLSMTAGAINDQATLSAAFPSLMEMLGPQAAQLKLTGIYEQDKSKLDFLSKAGATWAQKATVAERDKTLAQNEFFKGLGASVAQQRLQDAQKRTQLLEAAGDRAAAGQKERERENAARDARLAAGVRGDPAKEYTKNLKVDKLDLSIASDTFNLDPRTADMDDNLKKQYGELAARRAKELMANEIRQNPKSEINYDTALSGVMDQMDKEGLFKPTSTNWAGSPNYEYKPPSWTKGGGTGQGTPPAGKATKPAAPAGTYTTPDQVMKAKKAGKLTYDEAAELLKKM